MAVGALVTGILGCCVPYINWILAITAIILGVIAKNKIKEDPNRYGGQGMATTGIVLGIISLVVTAIVFILYLTVGLAVLAECDENPNSEFCREFGSATGAQPDVVASAATGAQPGAASTPMVASAAPFLWARPWSPTLSG